MMAGDGKGFARFPMWQLPAPGKGKLQDGQVGQPALAHLHRAGGGRHWPTWIAYAKEWQSSGCGTMPTPIMFPNRKRRTFSRQPWLPLHRVPLGQWPGLFSTTCIPPGTPLGQWAGLFSTMCIPPGQT